MNTPKYIIIHSTDVSYKKNGNQFNSVNNYHKGEGFPKSSLGFYVGYHHLITGGIDYKAKEEWEVGAHTNQVENGISINLQSLGVCVGFDGDIEYPLSADYDLLQKRVWAWQDQYKIPKENVRYHRTFNTAKTCPGSLCGDEWMKNLLKRPDEIVPKQPEQEARQIAILMERVTLLQRLIALYQQLKNYR